MIHQNRTFKNDAKIFYRQITARQIKVTNPPEQQAVEQFRKGILENETSFESNWIDVEETLYEEMKSPEWKKIGNKWNDNSNQILPLVEKNTRSWQSS